MKKVIVFVLLISVSSLLNSDVMYIITESELKETFERIDSRVQEYNKNLSFDEQLEGIQDNIMELGILPAQLDFLRKGLIKFELEIITEKKKYENK